MLIRGKELKEGQVFTPPTSTWKHVVVQVIMEANGEYLLTVPIGRDWTSLEDVSGYWLHAEQLVQVDDPPEQPRKKSMKELAQEALDVQDACNLSGVVHGFSRAITRLRELLTEELGQMPDTNDVNQHPICKLYSDKISDLSRMRYDTEFSPAWDKVMELARAE